MFEQYQKYSFFYTGMDVWNGLKKEIIDTKTAKGKTGEGMREERAKICIFYIYFF